MVAPRRVASVTGVAAGYFRARHAELFPVVGASAKLQSYADDPVRFAREVLRIELSRKQCEVIRGVLHARRVAVVSGHKTGKSTTFAVLALWFYCTQPENARVVITATTERQVKGIIWREIKRLLGRARRAGAEIPFADAIHDAPDTGLINRDNSNEILGYTARQVEAIAGVSGNAILYLVDEASGVDAPIFDAIEGNRAGGNAWVFLASNPTKADGEFYEAFHKKSQDAIGEDGYKCFRIDSRESPNVTGEWRELKEWRESSPGRGDHDWRERAGPIPGMATKSWCDGKVAEHGEDSAFVAIRIAGKFVVAEEAKVFPLGLLIEAQKRYEDADASGRLWIGVDPAGKGVDASAFAARRSQKLFEVRKRQQLTEDGHLTEVLALIRDFPATGKPVVVVDSDGAEGAKVWPVIFAHAQATGDFLAVRFRGSDKPINKETARIYGRNRDALYANGRQWINKGGALPDDEELETDLHAPEFKLDLNNRLKLTPKEDLKKVLHRSPDKGDAAMLSMWEPKWLPDSEHQTTYEDEAPPADDGPGEATRAAFDPYRGGMR